MARQRGRVEADTELSRPQLRAWLAGRRGIGEGLAGWVINSVEREERTVVEAALSGGQGRDDLLSYADRYIVNYRTAPLPGASGRATPAPSRPTREVAEAGLRPDEEVRAAAVSMALAKDADTTEVVHDLRNTVLLGRVLTPEEARALLASPAAAVLGAADFLERGIPLVGHASHVLGSSFENGTLDVELAVTPGGTIRAELRGLGEAPGLPAIEYESARAEIVRAPLWPASVLDMLRLGGAWLAERYPWRERDGVWFLLTNRPPTVWPLRYRVEPQLTEPAMHALVEPRRHYMRAVVTLEIEPWVDAKTVTRAYRAIQQRLARGRDKRKLEDRNLHVFAFVVGQIDRRGRRPPFPELMERWNARDLPEGWRYADPRRFNRDFNRARDALLSNRYDFLFALTDVREEHWSPAEARAPSDA